MLNNQNSTPLDGFEGPEKKLEVDFVLSKNSNLRESSLRNVSKETWQQLLDFVNCKILSVSKNEYFDAFVLSESSLFVYDLKFLLKTCGTTTLLHCIKPLLTIAAQLNLELSFVCYSRSKFIYPDKQKSPHLSFEQEVEYLDTYFNGSGYIFGPMKNDHWNMYIADYNDDEFTLSSNPEQTLEVIMFDLDPKTMKQFYKTDDFVSAKKTCIKSGISKLLPGSIIDAFQFEPCGFSLNGLLDNAYWTIHITPEEHCSYVSFETNVTPQQLGKRTYADLVRDVVKTFKPGRFYSTLFIDTHTFENSKVSMDWTIPKYRKKNKTNMRFDGPYALSMISYERENYVPAKSKHATCASSWMRLKNWSTLEDDLKHERTMDDELIKNSPSSEDLQIPSSPEELTLAD